MLLFGAEDNRMQIAAWLQSLGLERYLPAFRDNDVDWAALPKLSAEDLKDLGVVLGGHRRKLLDAIAVLRPGAPTGSELVATMPPARARADIGAEQPIGRHAFTDRSCPVTAIRAEARVIASLILLSVAQHTFVADHLMQRERVDRRLAAILAADIAGYSRRMKWFLN